MVGFNPLESRGPVLSHGIFDLVSPSVTRGKTGCDVTKHPGPTEIQPIEMAQPPIGPITRYHGGKNDPPPQTGNRPIQPCREVGGIKHPAEQPCSAKRWRQKVLSRWLQMDGAIGVLSVECQGGPVDQLEHRSVPDRFRPVTDQYEGEGGLGVGTASNRMGQVRKPSDKMADDDLLERKKRLATRLEIRMNAHMKFARKRKNPRLTVGTFESGTSRQVVAFRIQIVDVESTAKHFDAFLAHRTGLQRIDPSNQQPMPVHGGMPIEATAEHGSQVTRRGDLAGRIEYM